MMKALEHRIPPPLLLMLFGLAMWGVSYGLPAAAVNRPLRYGVGIAVIFLGGAIAGSGIRAFSRAKTTINPVNIEAASSLVVQGIYQYTRNPMYVGLTTILTGWSIILGVPWLFLGPVCFALFINRFQIIPEERVMLAKFGDSYLDYKRSVRRWL